MKMSNQDSCFCLTQLQILMSVALEKTTVTGMQNVQTLLVALNVIVAKDMLEMVCNVEVSFVLFVHLLSKALQSPLLWQNDKHTLSFSSHNHPILKRECVDVDILGMESSVLVSSWMYNP